MRTSTTTSVIVIPQSRWAMVASRQEGASRALEELAEAYWYPAYAFFRAHGSPAEVAAAKVEGLLSSLAADPLDGSAQAPRFREWFLGLASANLSTENVQPTTFEIERDWAEQRFAREPNLPPEQLFVRRWALTLMESALALLEREYAAGGRRAELEQLRGFLGYSGSGEEAYTEAAEKLGLSESAARIRVFELRKRFRELLHAQIMDTVAHEDLADDEHRTLLAAL